MIRHGETGQFLSPKCQDSNCDGELVPGVSAGPFREPVWACNGLVSIADYGPLVACERVFPRSVY